MADFLFPALYGLPGGFEWIVILIIVLILFGSRIPGLGRSLGAGIREFKDGLSGNDEEATGDNADSASDPSPDKTEAKSESPDPDSK